MAHQSPTAGLPAVNTFSSGTLAPASERDLFHSANTSRRPSLNNSSFNSHAASIHSKGSSSSLYQSTMSVQPPKPPRQNVRKRLQSQYPRDSENSHVEFILVAAFDIDQGSIMEHQYPCPISGDETMLAELMLPDQVHSRSEDWTVFFLHKDSNTETDGDSPAKPHFEKGQANGHGVEDDLEETMSEEYDYDAFDEGPPLIYVLNHVNTKHDSSVTRGAVVKAMAICTRHSFLDIFKPVLILAIQEYFKSPTLETLEILFNSLNSMDLSLMPRLSLLERIILQASNARDLFIEKFERMLEQANADQGISSPESGKRPGETTPQQPSTRDALPKDTHEFESKISFKGHPIPVKVPTARSPEIVGNFSTIKLIQTFSAPHASSPQPFALHPHLTTAGAYTHPIIVLVNALLTQKRIVFLGHNRPSEEVAEAVLAACSLASGGVLRGFTRHAFPYTDLTKVDDLQKVPGFIAGVTNPIFAATPKWWDLLCDLPTGRMKISNQIEQPQMTDGWDSFQQSNPSIVSVAYNTQGTQSQDYTGDGIFMEAVLRNISNRLGEGIIRSMWRDWIYKITRIAAAFEEIVYGASALYIGGEQADQGDFGLSGHGYVWSDEQSRQRELAANVSRIEGWRHTRSYFSFKQDLIHLYNARPIKTIDLHHHHDRLRTQKLPSQQSAKVFIGLADAVHTHAEICQLLVVASESHGGLFYISLGMFHPQKEVRYKTVELLNRIGQHEAGRHFYNSLGRYARVAFFRIKKEKDTNAGQHGEWDPSKPPPQQTTVNIM